MLFSRKSQLAKRVGEPDPFICPFRYVSSLFSAHELNYRRSRYVSVVAQRHNPRRHMCIKIGRNFNVSDISHLKKQ